MPFRNANRNRRCGTTATRIAPLHKFRLPNQRFGASVKRSPIRDPFDSPRIAQGDADGTKSNGSAAADRHRRGSCRVARDRVPLGRAAGVNPRPTYTPQMNIETIVVRCRERPQVPFRLHKDGDWCCGTTHRSCPTEMPHRCCGTTATRFAPLHKFRLPNQRFGASGKRSPIRDTFDSVSASS